MTSIRPLLPEGREQPLLLVQQQTHFLPCEKDIAMEVIDEALQPAEDYKTLEAVEEDGRISGFISYGPIPLTEKRYDLYWIVVDPAYGRRSIRSRLIKAMEKEVMKPPWKEIERITIQ